MAYRFILIDCLARGSSGRKATIDVIGAGPRVVAGILESIGCHVVIDIPERISLKRIKYYAENFDAIFIGVGAGLPVFMNIEGESLGNIFSANELDIADPADQISTALKLYDELDKDLYGSNLQ